MADNVTLVLEDPANASNLNVFGSATSSLTLDLQGLQPADYATIKTKISDAVDLCAWDVDPDSTTANVTINQYGSGTIADGSLVGSAQTGITLDISTYLPASHALVYLHITDAFDFDINGEGYTNVTLTGTGESASGVSPDTSNSLPSIATATFDLAKFAASVLGTAQWDISFATSLPSESLNLSGHFTRVIDAEADILSNGPGSEILDHLVYHGSENSSFSFDNHTGPAITQRFVSNGLDQVQQGASWHSDNGYGSVAEVWGGPGGGILGAGWMG
jgi:hypothetical protein